MGRLGPEPFALGGSIAVGVVALALWLARPGEERGDGATEVDARASTGEGATGAHLLGLAVALVLFLLTLLSRPPFAPGGRLGVGILIGGAIGAVVAWLSARDARTAPGSAATPFAVPGSLGAAVIGAALVSLIYRGDPTDALVGLILGQSVVLLFSEGSGARSVSIFLGAGAAVAAGVCLAIGQYEDMNAAERLAVGGKLWWSLPVLALAALLVGLIVATLASRSPVARSALTPVVGGALLALLAARFPRYWSLLLAPAAGYLSGLLAAALAAPPAEGDGVTSDELPAASAFLTALLLLVLLIVAYRLHRGLGIALAALGFAGSATVITHYSPRIAGPGLLLLALASLFRLFYSAQNLESTSIYLTAHYALIGLAAGCLAPLGLGLLGRPAIEEAQGSGLRALSPEPRALSRSAVLGQVLVVVVLPLVMLLLWGLKASAGMVLGLAVGQAFLAFLVLIEGAEGRAGRAALAAPASAVLLLAVICVQLLAPLAPLVEDWTRLQRAIALLILVALLPLWTLVSRRGRSQVIA
jgi:hypothetical protein